MLSPKRVKWRRQHRGNFKGFAMRGSTLAFGDFGLCSIEAGRLSARQLEAARIAISRSVKRGGKLWLRICRRHKDRRDIVVLGGQCPRQTRGR